MRICKNEITDLIREHFRANPLKVPESRIQPLTLLEIKDKKLEYLGSFEHLILGGFPEQPKVQESLVSNLSGISTKKVPIKFGFSILENFLKAFGLDPATIGASLKSSKQLAFSFDGVKRLYMEPLELGEIISSNSLTGDIENFFLHKILTDTDYKLGLITDVLVSDNFILQSFTEKDHEANIDFPLLHKYITDVELDVTIETKKANEIKFQGQMPLTFAFSCVELIIDPKTGLFSRGDWLKNLKESKSLNGDTPISEEEKRMLPYLLIDDVESNPLLLEF